MSPLQPEWAQKPDPAAGKTLCFQFDGISNTARNKLLQTILSARQSK
jgi:hypothetical protein